MEQTAIRIDEEVWLNAPARQWVLSCPLRWGVSDLAKDVLEIITVFSARLYGARIPRELKNHR